MLVTVTEEELAKLACPAHDTSSLSILARHASKFQAVALQLAHRDRASHVVIVAESVWWDPDAAD